MKNTDNKCLKKPATASFKGLSSHLKKLLCNKNKLNGSECELLKTWMLNQIASLKLINITHWDLNSGDQSFLIWKSWTCSKTHVFYKLYSSFWDTSAKIFAKAKLLSLTSRKPAISSTTNFSKELEVTTRSDPATKNSKLTRNCRGWRRTSIQLMKKKLKISQLCFTRSWPGSSMQLSFALKTLWSDAITKRCWRRNVKTRLLEMLTALQSSTKC